MKTRQRNQWHAIEDPFQDGVYLVCRRGWFVTDETKSGLQRGSFRAKEYYALGGAEMTARAMNTAESRKKRRRASQTPLAR